jgi:SAM-dependent methyltransferase
MEIILLQTICFWASIGIKSWRNQSINQSISFLEIGFGTGAVLKQAHKSNWHVFGVDVISQNVQKLKMDLPDASLLCCNIDPFGESIKSIFPNKGFDVIAAYDVLEHFVEPYAFLTNIKNRLNQGGIVCLVVPRADARLDKTGSWTMATGYPIEHYFDISQQGLKQLVGRCGLRLRYIANEPFECLRREGSINNFTVYIAEKAELHNAPDEQAGNINYGSIMHRAINQLSLLLNEKNTAPNKEKPTNSNHGIKHAIIMLAVSLCAKYPRMWKMLLPFRRIAQKMLGLRK